MTFIFQAMQSAVDFVKASDHPENKISACIFYPEEGWHDTATNFWPSLIETEIGRDQKIGNSSGTIHAETACIFHAAFEKGHAVKNSSIAVTDPPCPNCVKNMAEAGIQSIYIDHKGFHKDFALRRLEEFKTMSLRLAQKAGIGIYEVNRREQTVIPLISPDPHYTPVNENPVRIISAEEGFLPFNPDPSQNLAMAFCRSESSEIVQIIAESHPALGFGHLKDAYEIKHPKTKYSYYQDSCNRLLMHTARHGLLIAHSEIWSSMIPSSREQVNLVGAGITKLHLPEDAQTKDPAALVAKHLLEEKKIIQFQTENSVSNTDCAIL
ncbi:MAG: hypothetical protein H6855_02605 [Rhodospirillales bacterium]|nr:hypothetical protein [Rhodospirillales bacterium]MCB9964957.1 hypothetical protein [Rhodospirillales bacterium]MCB9973451.1 hypothetical protein [Rhodospirillales bacterium]